MVDVTLNATYGGKPLSELARLIGERRKWLHETARDSVIATAITSLQSIAAATAEHPGKGVKIVHG